MCPQAATPKVLDNYELLEPIGKGGMAMVFKARHLETGAIVAIKVLSRRCQDPVVLRRFEQEFHAAHRLSHPNIVQAIEFCNTNSRTYLVMEYVDGESLGDRIARDGPMPEAEAVRIIVQAAQGVQYAHEQGVIHRDIKPDNLLLTPDGQVKLTDLGLAKTLFSPEDLTQTGSGLGTPHFMAPEQFRDAKHADARCDIYGLAATLYMMVTGKLPFGQCSPMECWLKKNKHELEPPRAIVPTLSKRTEFAINRAMATAPENRPATLRAFVLDLAGRTKPTHRNAVGDTSKPIFVSYTNHENQVYFTKQTVETLRRWIRSGLLNNACNVRGSWKPDGPYHPLNTLDGFHDVVMPERPAFGPVLPDNPAPCPEPAPQPTRWRFLAMLVVAVMSLVAYHLATH